MKQNKMRYVMNTGELETWILLTLGIVLLGKKGYGLAGLSRIKLKNSLNPLQSNTGLAEQALKRD
jgi:hypothetical protein